RSVLGAGGPRLPWRGVGAARVIELLPVLRPSTRDAAPPRPPTVTRQFVHAAIPVGQSNRNHLRLDNSSSQLLDRKGNHISTPFSFSLRRTSNSRNAMVRSSISANSSSVRYLAPSGCSGILRVART